MKRLKVVRLALENLAVDFGSAFESSGLMESDCCPQLL
jgi:hypothetical protein